MTAKKKTGGRKSTPVKFKGNSMPPNQMQSFMEEWSLNQAEANHVETIEEANDFQIYDEEDEDFFQNLTVYEMHDQAEENLAVFQANQPTETAEGVPEPGQPALTDSDQPENIPPSNQEGSRGGTPRAGGAVVSPDTESNETAARAR